MFKRPWWKIVETLFLGVTQNKIFVFSAFSFTTFNPAKQKVQTSIEWTGFNCMSFIQHVYFPKWRNWTKSIPLNTMPNFSQFVRLDGEHEKRIHCTYCYVKLRQFAFCC